MRPQKKLSKDLSDVERYMATEHVIQPKEIKKIFKRLILKADKLEKDYQSELLTGMMREDEKSGVYEN